MGIVLGDIHEPGNFSTGGNLMSMGQILARLSFFNVHATHLRDLVTMWLWLSWSGVDPEILHSKVCQ